VISYERGKDREVVTTSGTYQWSCVTQILHKDQTISGMYLLRYDKWNISVVVCYTDIT
jgi:hypothetical protein